MIRLVTISLLLTFLAGCATLNEAQCERGDWYGIGVADGADGRLPDHFARHVKACSKQGVRPQQTPWEQGRQRGLRLYCTPEKAYQVGRNGSRPSPVCTAQEAAAMAAPNAHGLEYYRFTQEIARVESRINETEDEMRNLNRDDETYLAAYGRLNLRLLHLEGDLRRLEHRRERYATWPPYYGYDRY